MSSKTTEIVTDTCETTTTTDCASAPECAPACPPAQTSSCGYNMESAALWIVALIFIILWTLAVGCMVSRWSSRNNKSGDDCDNDDRSCNFGVIGGILIWLIVLIIFVAVVFMWSWVGLVVFIVLAILIGAIIFASCSWGGNDHKKKDKRDC